MSTDASTTADVDLNSFAGFALIHHRRRYVETLLTNWAGALHSCLTSCIPIRVQESMDRKADA